MNKLLKFLLCLFCIPLLTSNPLPLLTQTDREIINIDDTQITENAGSYPVTITYRDENGKETTEEIYVTIYAPRTIVYNGEAIDAHDIELTTDIVADLTDTDLIKLANAKAWLTKNGASVPIAKVEKKRMNTSRYEITFTSQNNAAATINLVIRPITTEEMFEKEIYFYFLSHRRYFYILLFIFLLILCVMMTTMYHAKKMKRHKEELQKMLKNTQEKSKEKI